MEGQYLRSVQENLDLLRLVFSGGAGPLFRNREFIVYERRETMDDGTQVQIFLRQITNLISGLPGSVLVPIDVAMTRAFPLDFPIQSILTELSPNCHTCFGHRSSLLLLCQGSLPLEYTRKNRS